MLVFSRKPSDAICALSPVSKRKKALNMDRQCVLCTLGIVPKGKDEIVLVHTRDKGEGQEEIAKRNRFIWEFLLLVSSSYGNETHDMRYNWVH